jgi:TPR repeat protein
MNRVLTFLIAGMWLIAPALADFEAGIVRFEQGDLEGAVRELTPVAVRGDSRAQYMIGAILLTSAPSEAKISEAADWIKKAARQGHVEAQVELARLYRIGLGVAQDTGKMVKWYEAAAGQGHVGAQLLVADAYAYGQGVEQDFVQAYVWYEIAMKYWGSLAKNAHDMVASQMTPAQISKAKNLASVQLKKTGK